MVLVIQISILLNLFCLEGIFISMNLFFLLNDICKNSHAVAEFLGVLLYLG